MAANFDLTIARGASYRLALQYPQGAPTDLSSGWTAQLTIRERADDTGSPVLNALSSGPSPRIVLSAGSASLPNIAIELTPADTLSIPPGRYVYDLILTQGSYVKALLYGDVVTRTVTVHA
jgi:hypothetical protein